MAVQIQLRRDTASNWASANPILASGEMGAETDTGRFKVGNGSTPWNSLDYATAPFAYNALNTQAGTTYTFLVADQQRLTSFTSSSAVTATVPLNSSQAFPIGSRVDILQRGSGQVTIAATGGVTINTNTTLKTRDQYSIIALVKIGTDEWVATGDLAVV